VNDIAVPVTDLAADLARIGRALGEAGVGLEGGGAWSGEAHYLVRDGDAALRALRASAIDGAISRPVLIAPLRVDRPGELGRMMAVLVEHAVTVVAQYSDHDNRKVFVIDDVQRAEEARGAMG